MKILIVLIFFVCSIFAQDDNAQDADRHQSNPYNSSISPQGRDDPYRPFHRAWSKPSKYTNTKFKYKKADVDDVLGKWKYLDPPSFTVEFSSDSLGKIFHIYDRAEGFETSGKWSDSYSDDMLIIVLKYFENEGYEKLAIKRISKRKLALGSNVNGEFVPKVHIKKQR